jgi:hypothetical protein
MSHLLVIIELEVEQSSLAGMARGEEFVRRTASSSEGR